MNGNVEKLEAAGVVIKTPLPDAYAEVLENLSDAEVDAIVAVKQKLDEAGASAGLAPAVGYLNLIVI